MKNICIVLSVLSLAIIAGCNVQPNAGEQDVLIKHPWIFGHGGVDPHPVSTGLTFIAPTTDAVTVNMQPRAYELVFTDLMTSDGVPLGFDSKIRLKVNDSVKLIQNFGSQWYENNIQPEFSNQLRQAVRQHGMNETAISTTAIDAINASVTAGLNTYIAKMGIPVTLIDVIVGKANPPDSIKSQRVETAAQEQRQQTEVQRKLAEDARKAAETSRALADNAYRQSLGLSPEQFVQLENINMIHDVCGHAHCTLFVGGSPSPVVNAK